MINFHVKSSDRPKAWKLNLTERASRAFEPALQYVERENQYLNS
jgi:hypothetical protein